ncbi:helix-turn-helix domain-containing protein [Lysinibacillus sp. BW-2-10]|uniref:helix-turn-helix domain-containing protein n=1 Tax=Lysinibacillus sp. BW-2-10 TaxID=2590030 RepID=UPI001180C70C|nr:helix-turn-helix transcriptional regulator [Lysinibacillus sp. BW-2-10]TSI05252.1 helix-turn-helix transcriptional regulator [Lysinibacillus sp. BW-2-10]
MNDLGKRIRKLRREKNLTLAELAGERLTKGMLSLIENGKAQPSIESLHYIAERIGVEVSTLLNDNNVEQLRVLLFEIEEDFKKISNPYIKKDIKKMKQMYEKIQIHREKLLGNHYEEIRLLDIATRLETFLHIDDDPSTMYDVIEFYEKIHAYNQVIHCFSFLGSTAFNRNDYRIALQFMQEGEKRVHPFLHLIDKLSILDMHYILTVLYAAIDDKTNTQRHLELALKIAHENKIYYRLDDFYRFTLSQAIGEGDEVKSRYYLEKLTQHAAFTEDKAATSMLAFFKAHYANNIEKNYTQVPSFASYLDYSIDLEEKKDILILYKIEEAYSYWAQGLYKEAIESSKNIEIPSYVHHPTDLAIMYQGFAIRALSHLELGEKELAKSEILYAYQGVNDFPDTLYKSFIQQAYEKIQYGKRAR